MTQLPKGLIALDIDGTITAVRDHLPVDVATYLKMLACDGWMIAFITGRTLHWGLQLLQELPFPYVIAPYNGALICSMPEKIVLFRSYLQKNEIEQVELLLNQFKVAGVYYTGPEYDDRTYICPQMLSEEWKQYLIERGQALNETWTHIEHISAIPDTHFIAVRCLETKERSHKLARLIEEKLGFSSPIMMDSYNSRFAVVQVTQNGITKGSAVTHVMNVLNIKGPIIAAGDDHNDVALLQNADVKIAMETAPQELLSMADVIAPSAHKQGIIQGLQEALQKVRA